MVGVLPWPAVSPALAEADGTLAPPRPGHHVPIIVEHRLPASSTLEG
jgi:hypothetical protein